MQSVSSQDTKTSRKLGGAHLPWDQLSPAILELYKKTEICRHKDRGILLSQIIFSCFAGFLSVDCIIKRQQIKPRPITVLVTVEKGAVLVLTYLPELTA